jgi:hypothetical protein
MNLDERAPIDPNSADQETLCLLPGVGPVLAERLIAARPFETLADLTRVPGIGAAAVERWSSFLALPSALEPHSGEAESEDVRDAASEGGDFKGSPDEGSGAEISAPWTVAATQGGAAIGGGAEGRVAPGSDADIRAAIGGATQGGETRRLAAKVELDVPPQDLAELVPETRAEEPEPPEPVAKKEPPALQKTVPGKTPARRPPTATRRYVGCLVAVGGLLILVLSIALSLGILARLNENQLRFASPAHAHMLTVRVDGLEMRVEGLARDVEGLRARLNVVETIGERMLAVEESAETLRSDVDAMGERLSETEGTSRALQAEVDAAATRVAELSAQIDAIGDDLSAISGQVDDLDADVETLQTESGRFQTFLEGLQALLESLFTPQGGQP